MLMKKLRRAKAEKILFRDINGDGIPDCIYIQKGGFMRFCRGKAEHMYKLLCAIQTKSGFKKPFLIKLFNRKPDAVMIDDVDMDGNEDIIYLKRGGFSHMDGKNDVFIYRLMFMKGNGDGSFQEPRQIALMNTAPERLLVSDS